MAKTSSAFIPDTHSWIKQLRLYVTFFFFCYPKTIQCLVSSLNVFSKATLFFSLSSGISIIFLGYFFFKFSFVYIFHLFFLKLAFSNVDTRRISRLCLTQFQETVDIFLAPPYTSNRISSLPERHSRDIKHWIEESLFLWILYT